MKIYHFSQRQVLPADSPDQAVPEGSFVWWQLARRDVEADAEVFSQQLLQATGQRLLHLHWMDCINPGHPSHYDFTSNYDLVIFRRVVLLAGAQQVVAKAQALNLEKIATEAVSFIVFPNLLISIHEELGSINEDWIRRLVSDGRPAISPADLMLRVVNMLVDSYLDLRKAMTQDLDYWQRELLARNKSFTDWKQLLSTRDKLHQLQDTCEEQHDAMQEWLDGLYDLGQAVQSEHKPVHDLLVARSRDIIEHIARVRQHVHRLEQSIDTTVQLYFSAQANRTNDIMRVLTAITAIFLPLNLITGFFGMNFDFLPLIHLQKGVLYASFIMLAVALVLAIIFWRKRYLAPTDT